MKHQKIYVNGMTCINCQNRIASTLQFTAIQHWTCDFLFRDRRYTWCYWRADRNRIWHSDFNLLPGNAEVICRNHYGRYGNKHAGNFSGSSKTEIKHSELWQKYNYKTSRKKQNSIYNRTLQRIYAVWPITVYADRCAGFGKLSDRDGVYVLF